MSIVIGFDTTHANIASLPKNAQVAGYSTGSPDICWTPADWDAHPGALRIDQDWQASDGTADYLDIETGAATNAEAARWYETAIASYHAAKRPGQRWPGIYTSASNITPLANALIADGVKAGPRLIIANWNLSEGQAAADLAAAIALLASGGADPFPVVGIQFKDPGPYDIDVYSAAWLAAVSKPVTHGPYRHLITGTQTLTQLAAERNTTAGHLLSVSESAYSGALMARPIEDGTPYWTTNP